MGAFLAMTGGPGGRVALVATLALASVACSGSDSDSNGTPVPTSPPTTLQDVASTTDPTTTVASTSTNSTTTTTEPTPATTTLEDLRQEIEADLNAGEQAFIDGGSVPGDAESIETVSLYFSGPSLSAVTTFYEQLVANEQALARDGEISSAHVVLELINVDGVTASIRNCHIDAAMTVVAASPDDIVNGDVVRYTSLNDILLVEGTWRLTMATHSPRRSGGRHAIDSR